MSKTPKSFVWHAQNPKNDIRVGGEPTKSGPVSGGVNILDLETGECRAPTPRDTEQQVGLLNAASVQLAKHYDMPCSVTAQTSAKLPDAQASYEKMTSLVMGAMAGTDFVDLVAGTIDPAVWSEIERIVADADAREAKG